MIRICALLLLLVVHFGCIRRESQSNTERSNASPTVASQPQSTANGFQSLTEKNLKRLDERFPKRGREILENTQRIEVYETEVCALKGYTLLPIEKYRFQGCKVLRRADVTDPALRKQLVEQIVVAIGTSDSGAACFDPRHGVRAKHGGRRVELLICFECSNFRGVSNEDSFAGGFSADVEEMFEQILDKKKIVKR